MDGEEPGKGEEQEEEKEEEEEEHHALPETT